MKRRIDVDALYRSLMRTCFKVESLGGKCEDMGVRGLGLDLAAARLRHAAERVAVQGVSYKMKRGLSKKQFEQACK
jgi:hypothetical protein